MNAESMEIGDYLARGGKLTSPENAPARYRAELLKIMATFVDSELAGAAGFAEVINDAPGIGARIAAARIVAEKTAHAGMVLEIMGDFGADTDRYARHHPWTARLPREAPPGSRRSEHDMRLAVLNYPLAGWTDAVVMNLMMGRAVTLQLEELSHVSYQPLAEAFRSILPVERAHADEGAKGLAQLLKTPAARPEARASTDYWYPRVALSFGAARPERFEMLKALGLRRTVNDDLAAQWRERIAQELAPFGIVPPRS